MIRIRNENDFLMIARQFYHNNEGNTEQQFQQDLRLIANLKLMIERYIKEDQKFNARLMLNIYIILRNIFGIATDILLRYKLPDNLHPYFNTISFVISGKMFDYSVFDDNLLKLLQDTIK